jgi:glycyl-tRNA synthetase alpha subunit
MRDVWDNWDNDCFTVIGLLWRVWYGQKHASKDTRHVTHI